MKTLIIGGGIAELTLRALMRQRGEHPVIIEKQNPEREEGGYMLGLLPLGGRVLNELGLQSDYLNLSTAMDEYTVHFKKGNASQNYPLDTISNEYGPYQEISRKALIQLLKKGLDEDTIRYNTTVQQLKQDTDKVVVIFDNGQTEEFDLVVAADGIHSQTRDLILTKDEYEYYDTGWGGWVSWMDTDDDSHHYHEFWGPGYFVGTYPVENRIGVFVGGPVNNIQKKGLEDLADAIHAKSKNLPDTFEKALDASLEDDSPFFWEFHDCRVSRWSTGRVVLLGDAAVGFLPTAGIGASMAMDSAAALDDELSRADSDHLEYALHLFENRQRAKVEKAQSESRKLGKWMFVESPLLSSIRDTFLPFYSLERMLDDFRTILENSNK